MKLVWQLALSLGQVRGGIVYFVGVPYGCFRDPNERILRVLWAGLRIGREIIEYGRYEHTVISRSSETHRIRESQTDRRPARSPDVW